MINSVEILHKADGWAVIECDMKTKRDSVVAMVGNEVWIALQDRTDTCTAVKFTDFDGWTMRMANQIRYTLTVLLEKKHENPT